MLRLCLIACLLVLIPAMPRAQETKPASRPTSRDTEVTGSPESAKERVEVLKKQLERLEAELADLREAKRRGGFVDRVQSKLSVRLRPGYRSIGERVKVKEAKLEASVMTVGERRRHPITTHFLVSGKPVAEARFQMVVSMLKKVEKDKAKARLRAFDALIKHTAAFAADVESCLDDWNDLQASRKRLLGGADFAAEAKAHSRCGSAKDGGVLETLTRESWDPGFMQELFDLPVGHVSEVIRSTQGQHVVRCLEKTDDTIRVQHIFRPYSELSRTAISDVDANRVRIAFRDQKDCKAWRNR